MKLEEYEACEHVIETFQKYLPMHVFNNDQDSGIFGIPELYLESLEEKFKVGFVENCFSYKEVVFYIDVPIEVLQAEDIDYGCMSNLSLEDLLLRFQTHNKVLNK